MGGFSTAYDLVSSEYGWDDRTIGDLPLARFRQITAAIQQRRFMSSRQENMRFSWLARTVSTFIAGGYMVEKGKPNVGLEAAQAVSYDDIEAASLGSKDSSPAAPKENSKGSYERFMAAMGQLDARGKMI